MEIHEENKVCDGANVYSKQEYIDVIYPQMKQKARDYYNQIAKGMKGPAVGAETSEHHAYALVRGRWRNEAEYVESDDLEIWQ